MNASLFHLESLEFDLDTIIGSFFPSRKKSICNYMDQSILISFYVAKGINYENSASYFYFLHYLGFVSLKVNWFC